MAEPGKAPVRPLPSRLYVIADVDALAAAGWETAAFVGACADAGARLFQLRAKALPASTFADLVDATALRLAGSGSLLLVNDRVDVARVAGADGVHLGQEDVTPETARVLLGPEAAVGLSTHTPAQIEAAGASAATYIAVGPVFDTRTKDTGYAAVGLDLVVEARRRLGPWRPVVAIGGITPDRAAAVIGAGADAVAVIGGVVDADPGRRVRAYLEQLARPQQL